MKLSNKILILDPNKILKCIAHCNWKNREERPASFHKWVKGRGLGFLTTLAKWNQEVEERLGEHTVHEHWPLTWCPYLLVKFSSFPKKILIDEMNNSSSQWSVSAQKYSSVFSRLTELPSQPWAEFYLPYVLRSKHKERMNVCIL